MPPLSKLDPKSTSPRRRSRRLHGDGRDFGSALPIRRRPCFDPPMGRAIVQKDAEAKFPHRVDVRFLVAAWAIALPR